MRNIDVQRDRDSSQTVHELNRVGIHPPSTTEVVQHVAVVATKFNRFLRDRVGKDKLRFVCNTKGPIIVD
jgi:hypothetical protein